MSWQFNPHEFVTPVVHEITIPKATLEHDSFTDGLIAPFVQLSLLPNNPNIFEDYI